MANTKHSPGVVKRNWHFMLIGMLVGGVLGYFIAGAEGLALGGGLGASRGLITGGLIGRACQLMG